MPGLIDAHQHATAGSRYFCKSANEAGTEAIWPGTAAHVVAQVLRELLRMGITTFRDVGGYDDLLVEARQAMRYGAFDGPRVLACGRIVSATSPGGRFFHGMYREADGADEIRKAVREQIRYGADFIKVMTTGARSVELEDPDPAQLTREEVRVLVEESHRMGYRVAAHCEGMPGTEIAIEEGIDTIEHGMYLNQRPDLLERMARDGQVLVPTVSCLYGMAGLGERIGTSLDDDEYQGGGGSGIKRPPMPTWTPLLVDLAQYNVEQAALTIQAARAAGVTIAMGFDWGPPHRSALELLRMIHMGLTPLEGLISATSAAARRARPRGARRHDRGRQARRPARRRRRPARAARAAARAREHLARDAARRSPSPGRRSSATPPGRRRHEHAGGARRAAAAAAGAACSAAAATPTRGAPRTPPCGARTRAASSPSSGPTARASRCCSG